MSVSSDGPAVKDDSAPDKVRFDLIPAGPLFELARVYTIGAKKYADRNWEKGLAWGRIFAAMMRHSWKWWRGETHDPVDGQHHLSSVAWCAFALMEYEQTHPELDDRPVLAADPPAKHKTVIKEIEITEAGRAELRRNTSKTTWCSPIGFACDRCGARANRPCLATDFGRGA
jgi:hypothetical protein